MKANEKAINGAVEWAVNIAKDNSFHYGRTKWAHKSGCYFCGTQSAKKKAAPKSQKSEVSKTYCCNPFVTAAFHHGAGAPSVDCRVKDKRIGLANDSNKPFKNTKEWKKITKKKANLKKGDVLQTPTHVMLYIGNNKIVHAAGHDDGPSNKTKWNNSIRVETLPSKQWSRTTKIYRYIGDGKFKDDKTNTKVYESKTYYINGSDGELNIRKGMGTDTSLVTVLTNGTEVKSDYKDGNWTHITSPVNGYAFSKYLSTSKPSPKGNVQVAIFPMKVLRFSSISTGAHAKCRSGNFTDKPVDLVGKDSGKDNCYAPCDVVCLRVYPKASHTLWFRSVDKVKTPSGEKYLYWMCEHMSVSGFKAGKTYKKGTKLFTENSYGNASGPHLHCSFGISDTKHTTSSMGTGWGKNSKGAWVMKIPKVSNVEINKALYLDKNFTTTIKDTRIKFKEC